MVFSWTMSAGIAFGKRKKNQVMKNWEAYVARQKAEFIMRRYPSDFDAEMVVVIPCYDEPQLPATLKSLLDCADPGVNTLVAVVINSAVGSPGEAVHQNRKTYDDTLNFARTFSTGRLRFFPLVFENLPRKHAGVGLARKIGMDLAVEYFLRKATPWGIVVSLDADCTVSENYLRGICDAYRENDKLCATVHNFRHRIEDGDLQLEAAARQYERYIRYFKEALRCTGFPYYWHTVGSAFSVASDAYVRVGGMGRQQGGEDFYFLQKVFQMGEIADLTDLFVYPMARFSDRVPFGTGPALQKIIAEPDGQLKVYAMQSFEWLKQFFDLLPSFFKQSAPFIERQLATLPLPFQAFLRENDAVTSLGDCNGNSASPAAFRKRFFHHFNAFWCIKCLNFLHKGALSPEIVDVAMEKCEKMV